MIKRVVILQDEQLVVREIERNMQRHRARRRCAAAHRCRCAAAAAHAGRRRRRRDAPPRIRAGRELDDRGGRRGRRRRSKTANGSLAAVAKAASMKAERAAIEQTLRQVHWNRRKAAQILGVSYKTLLNKIKECGISRA